MDSRAAYQAGNDTFGGDEEDASTSRGDQEGNQED